MPRTISLLILLCLCQSCVYPQKHPTDCNENPGSPYKLFVFIGERISVERNNETDDDYRTRYSATYRVLETICGDYLSDTIQFDVDSFGDDSSIFKASCALLALTRDSGSTGNDFSLSGQLHRDLFKNVKGQWIAPYDPNAYLYQEYVVGERKPRPMQFDKSAFYNTNGMTREEIDLNYPEPYYVYKQGKAIPVLGNTVTEAWQHMKNGNLADWKVYTRPPVKSSHNQLVVKDVQLEEIKEPDRDSMRKELSIQIKKHPFNEELVRRLVQSCTRDSNSNECTLFFQKLIAEHPDSAQAYVLKARFMTPRLGPGDSSLITVLEQAVQVDSLHTEANDMLVSASYQFFHKFPTKYRAIAARNRMMRFAAIDTPRRLSLRYPIIQLSNYLQDSATASLYENYALAPKTNGKGTVKGSTSNWYFPLETFFTPKQDWRHDYRVDMNQQVRMATHTVEWFSDVLKYFKEPVLKPGTTDQVYRFLWLRSFHLPVVFSLHKKGSDISINWKLAVYNRKLDKFESYNEKTKKLSIAEWNYFERLLATIEFWEMIPRDYLSDVADGAIWVLEGSVNGQHHVVERQGSVYPKYTKCLLYLMGLTDLHLPKDQVY